MRTPVHDEVQQTGTGNKPATLFYIHDPMCSWCWGFRPVFERLRQGLPPEVEVRRLLGGLAPDDAHAMPPAMRSSLQDTWRRIAESIPGVRFNFDFWSSCEPRRSTWPACRAVIAARDLLPGSEERMILAIQQAYYLEARNPSDRQTLTALATDLGIDASGFSDSLESTRTQSRLADEIHVARAMQATSFPSLRLQTRDALTPITVDYLDPAPMHTAVVQLLSD